MTIEIRQLVIRAVVAPDEAAAQAEAALPASALAGDDVRPAPGLDEAAREALLADCVREVLRRIERERER